MYSMLADTSSHTHNLDVVRRVYTAPAVATDERRDPSRTVLYKVIADPSPDLSRLADAVPMPKVCPPMSNVNFTTTCNAASWPMAFSAWDADTCKHEMLLAFSCKRRGFCPSCAGRWMAQTAAHLVERVIPWVPTRQWVVSVPMPLRYWMASSQD